MAAGACAAAARERGRDFRCRLGVIQHAAGVTVVAQQRDAHGRPGRLRQLPHAVGQRRKRGHRPCEGPGQVARLHVQDGEPGGNDGRKEGEAGHAGQRCRLQQRHDVDQRVAEGEEAAVRRHEAVQVIDGGEHRGESERGHAGRKAPIQGAHEQGREHEHERLGDREAIDHRQEPAIEPHGTRLGHPCGHEQQEGDVPWARRAQGHHQQRHERRERQPAELSRVAADCQHGAAQQRGKDVPSRHSCSPFR